jgi:hypothetical protein
MRRSSRTGLKFYTNCGTADIFRLRSGTFLLFTNGHFVRFFCLIGQKRAGVPNEEKPGLFYLRLGLCQQRGKTKAKHALHFRVFRIFSEHLLQMVSGPSPSRVFMFWFYFIKIVKKQMKTFYPKLWWSILWLSCASGREKQVFYSRKHTRFARMGIGVVVLGLAWSLEQTKR